MGSDVNGSDHPLSLEVAIDWSSSIDQSKMSETRAESLLIHALELEGQSGSWEIAIRFVDDDEMAQLHELYLGDATPTDILTFPYDSEDGMAGGDIVISVETASRNASEANWYVTDELNFLMLHGLLHIVGWDDQTDEARVSMLARQHALLDSWMRTNEGR